MSVQSTYAVARINIPEFDRLVSPTSDYLVPGGGVTDRRESVIVSLDTIEIEIKIMKDTDIQIKINVKIKIRGSDKDRDKIWEGELGGGVDKREYVDRNKGNQSLSTTENCINFPLLMKRSLLK